MRLAYVVADGGIPVSGTKGASVHVREMVRSLGQQHDVDLFCAQLGDGPLDLPARTVHTAPRPQRRRGGDPAIERDRQRLETVARLQCALEHAHARQPYDLIYERYALFSDLGASLASSFRIPLLLEVNAPLIVERKRVEPLPLSELAIEIERYVFAQADVILSVSEAMRTYVLEHGGTPEKTHVVPNGVDTSRFHPDISGAQARADLGIEGKVVIGFAGSLKPWHGVDLLIKAFSRLATPNCVLLIVGDGPQRTALEAQARALPGAEQILFTGAMAHDRVPKYLAAMDIAVAPFRPVDDFYFSPLKLFEYLAMGKPVVASNVGQISELVRHGENGLLTAPGSVDALVAALDRLIADPATRERLASHTQDGIVTWHEIAQRAVEMARALQPAGSST